MRNAVQTTYFCFSFGFLLVRTAAVSLFAAGVHDESVLAAPILYSVSTSNYSPEVYYCEKERKNKKKFN